MTIYYIIGALLAAFIVYRLMSSELRILCNHIGRKINAHPRPIKNMILSMGSEKGLMFMKNMKPEESKFDPVAAYTLVTYLIMRNQSEENIAGWKSKLEKAGIEPNMTRRDAELAFMYLQELGANPLKIDSFLQSYNAVQPIPPTGK